MRRSSIWAGGASSGEFVTLEGVPAAAGAIGVSVQGDHVDLVYDANAADGQWDWQTLAHLYGPNASAMGFQLVNNGVAKTMVGGNTTNDSLSDAGGYWVVDAGGGNDSLSLSGGSTGYGREGDDLLDGTAPSTGFGNAGMVGSTLDGGTGNDTLIIGTQDIAIGGAGCGRLPHRWRAHARRAVDVPGHRAGLRRGCRRQRSTWPTWRGWGCRGTVCPIRSPPAGAALRPVRYGCPLGVERHIQRLCRTTG